MIQKKGDMIQIFSNLVRVPFFFISRGLINGR